MSTKKRYLCTYSDVNLSNRKTASSDLLVLGRPNLGTSSSAMHEAYSDMPEEEDLAGKLNQLWDIGGYSIFRQLMWQVLIGCTNFFSLRRLYVMVVQTALGLGISWFLLFLF